MSPEAAQAVLFLFALGAVGALCEWEDWKERRRQRRREFEYSDQEECRKRWAKIQSGEIDVPIHTSRNGTQSINNSDLFHSPKFRRELERMRKVR